MMLKQIFCEENQKNNNAENFESENITLEAIKNKLETIWEYSEKYKCLYLLYYLKLLINYDINNRILLSFDKVKEKMPDIPDHCEKVYNIFYNYIYDEIKKQYKNEGSKFKLKFDLEESDVDVDCNTDSNHKEYVDNDKKENKIYDDELEQYYLKSRKDCVEYGLKSSDEDLIVCTKYE